MPFRGPTPPGAIPSLLALVLLGCKDNKGTGGAGSKDPSWDYEADVVIVGAGFAGLAAAWEAVAAGASVLMIEMQEAPGMSGEAGAWFGAGTSFQAQEEVDDSPERALEEWYVATGGDQTDPMVEAFVEASAEVVEWIASEAGSDLRVLDTDPDCGITRRKHWLQGSTVEDWLAQQATNAHTETRADSLVTESGRVMGVQATDLLTGEAVRFGAKAVVIATGGFARDFARIVEDRPALEGNTLLAEASLGVEGHGLPVIESVDADWQNEGHYGIYVHATADPRPGYEAEAVLIGRPEAALIVGLDGRRLCNEEATLTLDMVDVLERAPDQRAFAIFDSDAWADMVGMIPGYLWADPTVREIFSTDELLKYGMAHHFTDVASMATGMGIDEPLLEETLEHYTADAAAGEDLQFHKDPSLMSTYEDGNYYVIEFFPAAAKAFTGPRIDLAARILDATGTPIPGLYGAGEAVGFLGTTAVGSGFCGSMTAVAWVGRLAGEQASLYAESL